MFLIVFESRSAFIKNRCPPLRVYNARVRIRQSGQVARITCNSHFKLVQGNEIANCIRGEWDTETPICARKFILFHQHIITNISIIEW